LAPLDYYLVLFDMQWYNGRVEPTLREFFAGAPAGLLLPLLEESNRRATRSEAVRKRLLSHNIEPGEAIIRILTGQEISGASFADDLSLFEARESRPALEVYVSGPVMYEILTALCIPELPDINPQQNIGESALLSHLVEHSPWIERAFTGDVFGQGDPLRFPLGLQSEVMRPSDAGRLLAELKAMPPPDPRAGNEKQVAALRNVLSRITLRRGTAGLLAKMFESQAGRIIPAAPGERVADQIANLKRMLESSLADPTLAILFTLQ
jgi:hypothetical protein